MDLDRFNELSATFGAEKRRWPHRYHALYDRFANTVEGVAILEEAGRIDRFLDTLGVTATSPQRARQIGALARPAWRRIGKPAAALAASAAVGFVLGYLQLHSATDIGAAELLMGPQSLQEIGL